MRKRFVKVVLFGALTFAATTSFISCKDYGIVFITIEQPKLIRNIRV